MKKINPYRNLLKKPLDEISFVIFDLEATGGNPDKSGLTEIYALEYNPLEKEPKTKKEFYSLINPERKIPKIVVKITQITNDMVKDAPRAEKVLPGFLDFIEGKVLVSHNTPCDLKFIKHYSQILRGETLENFFLCSHLLSERLLSESKNKSLKGLCEYLGIEQAPNHRAKEDTISTLELFKHLFEKLKQKGFQTLEEAINFQGDLASAIKIGWKIPEEELKQVPPRLGSLNFKSAKKELLLSVAGHNCKKVLEQLSELHALPKGLARSLTKAHGLAYLQHRNILEAKLYALKSTKSHHSLYDLKMFNETTLLGLSISCKKENRYEVSLSQAKDKTLFFYGPLRSYKHGVNFLKELEKRFFPGHAEKNKLNLNKQELSELLLILEKNKFQYYMRTLSSNALSFSLKKGFEKVHSYSELEKKHSSFNRIKNLREQSGFLFIKSKTGKKAWELYCIKESLISQTLTLETSYDTWLTTQEGSIFVKAFLSSISQDKTSVRKPLNQKEAALMNLVGWFVQTQTSRKSQAIYFDKEDLLKMKP